MNHYYIYRNNLGKFRIEEKNNCIALLKKIPDSAPQGGENSVLITETIRELEEYFSGKRRIFQLPIRLSGTDFQLRVWSELMAVPYGQVITYGQLASRLGNPRSARAIGGACRCNPVQIIIPCHRVVAAGRRPGGYAGGVLLKQKLLLLEQQHSPQKTPGPSF